MRTRLLLGPLLLGGVLALFLADALWWPEVRPCVSLLIAAIGVFSWIEFQLLAGMGPRGPRHDRALYCAGVAGVLYFHGAAWWIGARHTSVAHSGAVVAGVYAVLLALLALVVLRREFLKQYRNLLETLLGVLLFGWLLSYLLRIYHLPAGIPLGVAFLVGVKGTDIAAYLVGSRFGRRRFLSVSPKKTVEGCSGALIFGSVWFCGVSLVLESAPFSWWQGAIFGIILGGVAQLGDLAESLIKREYQTKDSRALIPEFGGILDMIDSLLLTGYLFWSALRSTL